ncbi:MAG: hypothetical protein PHF84_06795 [bacterium]|nr:hypothetical protein [bacterium]
MMKKRLKWIILLYLSFFLPLQAEDISKHFMDAKLAYINSDFDTAMNECNAAIQLREVPDEEAQAFLDLVRFIRNFSSEKLKDARLYFSTKEYLKCIATLSDILKKDTGNNEVKKLYKDSLPFITEAEKKDLLERLNKEIEINKQGRNDTILIALYTEKLIIDENDEQTKIELKRVRLKYNSRQIKLEVEKMIKTLEDLISQKEFDLDKAILIVNNILYIDPENVKGKKLKVILETYKQEEERRKLLEEQKKKKEEEELLKKKQEEAIRNKIAETIEVKRVEKKTQPVQAAVKKIQAPPVVPVTNKPPVKEPEPVSRPTNIMTNVKKAAVTNKPVVEKKSVLITKIEKVETVQVKKEDLVKKENENKGQIHFNRGVNRYNNQLYKAAKVEFVLAGQFDTGLKSSADVYIRKCDEKVKVEEKKVQVIARQEVKKEVEKTKVLVKKEMVEKAINILYSNMVKNEVTVPEGEQLLKKIITRNVMENRLSVNPYSPLYQVLNYLKEAGVAYFNKQDYKRSLSCWQQILEFFPENKLAVTYLYKSLARVPDPKEYLQNLYDQAVNYYNSGDVYKSAFYFDLIINSPPFNKNKTSFKNIDSLNRKCLEYIKKYNKTESQLFQVYNSAVLDFINGDYDAAVVKWEYILKLEPGNMKSRFNLNKVNNILNNKESGEVTSRFSVEEIKKINLAYYNGIEAYNQNNYKKALSWFREVLKIYPEHQKALNNVSKINLILRSKTYAQ